MKRETKTAYCKVCGREVGIVHVRPWFGVVMYLVIGVASLLIPMIGCFIFPIFLILASYHYRRHTKDVCGICKAELK